jgi:hypothetical protein
MTDTDIYRAAVAEARALAAGWRPPGGWSHPAPRLRRKLRQERATVAAEVDRERLAALDDVLSRRLRRLPAMLAQRLPGPGRWWTLTVAGALARAADRLLAEEVRGARVDGATWTEVGQALGVSRQAATQRFGRA